MPSQKEKFEFIRHFMMINQDREGADLSGLDLSGACMAGSNFRSAICVGTNFSGCDLRKADFSSANLKLANFTDADLSGADMSMSYAKAALFLRARMWNTIVRHAIWKNALIIDADCTGMDVVGSLLMGARWDGTRTLDMRNTDRAIYQWWMSPWGGPPSYDPIPGWTKLDESIMGGISYQENAGTGQIE